MKNTIHTQFLLTGLCTTTHLPSSNLNASRPLLLLNNAVSYISPQLLPLSSESARSTKPVELLVSIDSFPGATSSKDGWIAPSPRIFERSIDTDLDFCHVAPWSEEESVKHCHTPSGVSKEAGAMMVPFDRKIHLFFTGPRPPVPRVNI